MLSDLEAAVFVLLMAVIVAIAPRISEAFLVFTYLSAG